MRAKIGENGKTKKGRREGKEKERGNSLVRVV
jgi:hypothetical protein